MERDKVHLNLYKKSSNFLTVGAPGLDPTSGKKLSSIGTRKRKNIINRNRSSVNQRAA